MSHPASDDNDSSKNIITLKGIRIEFKKKPKKGLRTLRAVFNGVPVNLVATADADGLSRHWTLDPEINLLPNFDDHLQFAYGDVGKGKDFFSLFKRQPEGFNLITYDNIASELRKGQKPTTISFPRRKWTIILEVIEGQLSEMISTESFDFRELDPLLDVEDVVCSSISFLKSTESIRNTLERISDSDPKKAFHVLEDARSDSATVPPFAKALITSLLVPSKLLDRELNPKQTLRNSAEAMLSACKRITDVRNSLKVTSAREQFASISKLVRDMALFIKLFEMKSNCGQTVGEKFLTRLAEYIIELDMQLKGFTSAISSVPMPAQVKRTEDGDDISGHLVVNQRFCIGFETTTVLKSLKVFFNGERLKATPILTQHTKLLVHEWVLECDIPIFPDFDDRLTGQVVYDSQTEKASKVDFSLGYNDMANIFKAQEEMIAIPVQGCSLWFSIATGSLKDFVDVGSIEQLKPLLPDVIQKTITSSESLVKGAEPLKSILDNLPIAEDVLQATEKALDTLAQAHPLARAVVTALSIPYKLLKNERDFKQNVESLAEAMRSTGKCLMEVRYHTKLASAKELFVSITKTLRNAALFLAIYRGKSRFRQLFEAQFPKRLGDYTTDLITKRNEFEIALITQIARDVDKIASMTSDDFVRKRLRPVDDQPLGEGCLENTRVKILEQVMDWIQDCDSEKNILWIVGAPGAGKTTIATSVAKKLAEQPPYCAEFFCKRDNPYLRDPRQIWRALAYSLSGKHDGVKAAIMRTLDTKKGDPQDYSVTEQFEELIKRTVERDWQETKFRTYSVPYPLLIIDALDECYTANDGNWDLLLESLTRWVDFKGPFKLIITSRDLVDIRRTLGGSSLRIDLTTGEDVSDDSSDDVMTFFDLKFSGITKKLPETPPYWPGETAQRLLTAYAAGLFVWADMVIKYVGLRTVGSNPVKRLEHVLSDIKSEPGNRPGATAVSDGRGQVDRLYARVIFEAFLQSEPDERRKAKRILALVILAKEPLRKSDIVGLLSAEKDNQDETLSSTNSTLRELSPIIYISEDDEKVRVCHKTVSDFLSSHNRSEAAMNSTVESWNLDSHQTKCNSSVSDFVLDCDVESRSLAFECLCALRLGLANDIGDIPQLLKQSRGPFYYARRYWIEHLESAGNDLTAVVPSFKSLSSAMEVAYDCLKRYSNELKFVTEEAGALTRCLGEAADFASQCIYPERPTPNDSQKSLRDLTERVDSARGRFQIAIVVRLAQDVDKLSSNPSDSFLRKRLQPADQTVLDDPCLEGTRSSILRQAKKWLESADPEEKNILWIVGGPGAGKSAIATSLVSEFSKDRLCAKFFAKRDYNDRRDPARVWRTFAYGLANLHVSLKGSIMEVLYKVSSRPGNLKKEQSQFRDLLVKALQDLHCLSCVFVLDALDECFSEDNEQWQALIQTLVGWTELRLSLKLVVTSRDIPEIRNFLENISRPIPLTGPSDEAERDVKIFLRTKLTHVYSAQVAEEEIEQLADHASGSFMWARMVAELVTKVGSVGPVKNILAGGDCSAGNVDILYGRMLWETLGQLQPTERLITRSMLATMVLAKDPLRKSDLEVLVASNNSSAHLTRDLVDRLIKELSSIISIGDNQLLRMPHKSFADFLLARDRSAPALENILPADQDIHSYLVDREGDSACMAIACLQLMKNTLEFNVCGIETSHALNKDGPQLQARISKHIGSLVYTCRFWAQHLNECREVSGRFKFHRQMVPLLETLLRKNLLSWFEVLSLTNAVPSAESSLQIAEVLLEEYNNKLSGVAKDARLFVKMFEDPITAAAPHIYLSALPFCPSDSWIARIYGPQYPSILSVVKGRQVNWNTSVPSDDAHEGGVNAVAFFPSRGRLASGSSRTVRVWDARTGHALAAPFTGHERRVCCVAISPDRIQMASGDYDGILRIWDSDTGACPLGSIKAHSGTIWSVAFSPDGSRVVTGSWDKTVKVWNIATGNLCLGPLTGHTSDVTSVAFSIDGTVIASGSDETIRISDAHTGESRREPFTGHTALVWCVAFSPDGRYLASVTEGSDSTIHLWDIAQQFSQTSATPVKGGCVALSFSPDSNTLVSGFNDTALGFWSVRCGKLEQIGAPIYGHIRIVRSVAFAPDGLSVASGSEDSSIRIWMVRNPSAPNLLPASAESLDAHGRPVLNDDSFIDDDGWMHSSRRDEAKVLFWVPEENRGGFWWPRNTAVIHRNVTKVDFRRFVHGEHWAECRRTSADSGII